MILFVKGKMIVAVVMNLMMLLRMMKKTKMMQTVLMTLEMIFVLKLKL